MKSQMAVSSLSVQLPYSSSSDSSSDGTHVANSAAVSASMRPAAGDGRPCRPAGGRNCDDDRMRDDSPPPETRRDRLWAAAEARNIPLRAILVTVAVVAATYVAGKLVYRLRDVILLMVVAGFIALILNPLVLAVQRLGRPAARAGRDRGDGVGACWSSPAWRSRSATRW